MTSEAKRADRVRVSVQLAVAPADAFEVFTLEIDQWWRRGPAYRVAGRSPGILHLEPGPGGRIFETYGAENSALHEVGRITRWEPPARFSFEWRAINFAPDDTTTVDVWFEAVGRGTRVTLEHSGWSTIRPDHPARHGQPDAAFIRELGLWWASLLTALREHASEREHPSESG